MLSLRNDNPLFMICIIELESRLIIQHTISIVSILFGSI